MRLNRDVILSGIIRHQNSFFKLLDYIDSKGGVYEFPEQLYIELYNRFICLDEDINVHTHLSLNSLLENGAFIHHDKNTGIVSVEDIIINVLRFLDVKRARELSHHELEDFRSRTSRYVQLILNSDADTKDFWDLLASFNRLLSEIHSKIKENVSGLVFQVEKISGQYRAFDDGNSDISVFDLYNSVTELYQRYVLPCYEFISPNMQIKGGQTFTQAIQSLIDGFAEKPALLYESNALQYRFTAISCYYKDIGSLVRKLQQFSNYLEQDRTRFIAIENAFNCLMNNVIPLRHGKQRNKYLSPQSEIFTHFHSLDGLSDQKSKNASRFNWIPGKTSLRFKEYLVLLESSETKKSKNKVKPLPDNINIDEERQIEIALLLARTKLPPDLPDIHSFVFQILKKNLNNFWLGDVLFGLEEFFPYVDSSELKYSTLRRTLSFQEYYLDYLVLYLCREATDV